MDKDKNWLVSNRKFTEEEMELYGKEILPQLPSYRAEDRSIESREMIPFFKMIKWPRTDSQTSQYILWTDKVWGGRITFENLRVAMLATHDRIRYLQWIVEALDSNGDGYISREEYEFGMDLMAAHEPTLAKVPYEQMVREADLNGDGLINIDEMMKWLEKIDNRIQL